ncbi:cohesin domain-containing protein [Paraherbaspirillum soli]|uniref:Cohesin domain-containing protein n=1 Tax=Paraherbaspirillum soli TaxID=631222 RepID=A0ABW0M8B4_9BURK
MNRVQTSSRSGMTPGAPWQRLVGVLVLGAMLAGCAGTREYREGNTLLAEGKIEPGLAKLEEAVKLDPKNAEYRIALSSRRSSIINQLVMQGETARREGRLSDAEKSYRQALNLDQNNNMARQGIEALVMERHHRQVVIEAEALFKKGSRNDLIEALEKLRPVLSENPNQKDALNLKSRIDEARAKASKPEAKLAAAYMKPITLEFRDAPLRTIFEVIAQVSGLNFFFDKELRPDLKASILAKNTSMADVVRLLLVTNQLEQKVLNENSILIYPSTPQKLKDYQTLAVRTFYLTNADVKAVSNTIKTIVKTKDMVIDERLGLIILRDTPEAIRMAEKIVALQDLSDPEVMLEVEVLEIKRSRMLELGIQWPSQLTLAPLQVAGAPLTLDGLRHLTPQTTQATVGSMVFNANKGDQDGNILANPRIRVRNKEKAKVLIGDRVPVITTTSTNTGFVSESVNYVDVGLKLEVEPTIYLDEEVAIKVNLEVSSIVREITSKAGTLSYQIGTRGANTILRLKDGETQILAGLINDEDRSTANKVPGLGELPLIGRLFGSQKDDTQRSEILLSITPRVVRSIRRPDLLAAEFESGTETNIGAESLTMNSVETVKAAAPATTSAAPAATPAAIAALGANAAPASAPAATDPVPAAVNAGPLSLNWQTPAEVKVGEQFSAVLRVSSQGALRGMPLLIGFDPQLLQVVSVQEGDFFKQNGGATNFSHRIDPAQGKVFIAAVRQNATGTDAGVNGAGGIVTVNFKALKPTAAPAAAKLQLLSASPEPVSATPIALPLEQLVRIVP